MTSQDYKAMMRAAKGQLAGNWLNAAIVTLIYVVIVSAASSIYVGQLIVAGPLALGYALYIINLANSHRSDMGILFSGFNRFLETLVAGLLISIATAIGLALLIVPGIIVACGFSMTYFIMADDSTVSGIDAMKRSWNLMNGHKMEYFVLNLRFIGWILLSCLTLGILCLWVAPYMQAAYLNFYRKIRYGSF
ncbi:MAG: DUF975 family protein [Muribaculaceae bacterium]|nr:DUF975 family protein [Muribaculaceae bacterium]